MLSIYRDGARDPFAYSSWYDPDKNRDNDRVVNFYSEESENIKTWELAEFDALRWLKNISSFTSIGFASFLVILSLISFSFADTAQAFLVLKRGSRGSFVVALQNRLREAGYYGIDTTGYYGPITERAVRNYQRSRNLLVDGIAGPQTLTSMDLTNVGGEIAMIGNGMVTASNLNLREGPGTGYRVVASISRGTRVNLYERSSNGWYKVDGPNRHLWVSGNYIRRI